MQPYSVRYGSLSSPQMQGGQGGMSTMAPPGVLNRRPASVMAMDATTISDPVAPDMYKNYRSTGNDWFDRDLGGYGLNNDYITGGMLDIDAFKDPRFASYTDTQINAINRGLGSTRALGDRWNAGRYSFNYGRDGLNETYRLGARAVRPGEYDSYINNFNQWGAGKSGGMMGAIPTARTMDDVYNYLSANQPWLQHSTDPYMQSMMPYFGKTQQAQIGGLRV